MKTADTSLITLCPDCRTTFHVSREQLKRHSGMVRCGICKKPFNGIDHLIGYVASKRTGQSVDASNISPKSETKLVTITSNTIGNYPDSRSNTIPVSGSSEDDTNKALLPSEEALKKQFEQQLQTISLELNDVPSNNDQTGTAFSEQLETSSKDSVSQTKSNLSNEKSETSQRHSFSIQQDSITNKKQLPDDLIRIVQQKKQKSRAVSIFLLLGILLLTVCLCGQMLYRYSEQIVMWWPPAKNWVNKSCEILSCPTRSPTTPSTLLHIEYSKLTAVDSANGQFTQQITLTNNSPSPQLWPSLMIEISDTAQNILSRRKLEPKEYLSEKAITDKELAPSEKVHFQLNIEYHHDTAINSRIMLFNH